MERITIDEAAAVYDVDVSPADRWVALARRGAATELVFDSGRRVALPRGCAFPLARLVAPGLAVLIDRRSAREENNAWVIADSGELRATFSAGDAIQDLVVAGEQLVVTYFDEAASNPLSGAVAFDLDGQIVARLLDDSSAPQFIDCYAACVIAPGRVLLFVYPDFPLVEWIPSATIQRTRAIPESLAGASAMTTSAGEVYFHGCSRDRSGIFRWRFDTEALVRVGSHSGKLRGLAGGRFLELTVGGCVVHAANSTQFDAAAT